MGALTNIDFTKIDENENKYTEIKESNGVIKRIKNEPKPRINYSFGKIQKLVKFFLFYL